MWIRFRARSGKKNATTSRLRCESEFLQDLMSARWWSNECKNCYETTGWTGQRANKEYVRVGLGGWKTWRCSRTMFHEHQTCCLFMSWTTHGRPLLAPSHGCYIEHLDGAARSQALMKCPRNDKLDRDRIEYSNTSKPSILISSIFTSKNQIWFWSFKFCLLSFLWTLSRWWARPAKQKPSVWLC